MNVSRNPDAARAREFGRLGDLVDQEVVYWRVLAHCFSPDAAGSDRIVEGFLIELHMRMDGVRPPYHVDDISDRFIACLRRHYLEEPIFLGPSGRTVTPQSRPVSFAFFAGFASQYLQADDPEQFASGL